MSERADGRDCLCSVASELNETARAFAAQFRDVDVEVRRRSTECCTATMTTPTKKGVSMKSDKHFYSHFNNHSRTAVKRYCIYESCKLKIAERYKERYLFVL